MKAKEQKARRKKIAKPSLKTPKKTDLKNLKKKIAKKQIPREKLRDFLFMTGPIKKLVWTKWELAISKRKPPKIPGAVYKLSERYNVFLKKNLFKNDLSPSAVYEVGATLPGSKKRRIYPLYFRKSIGFNVYKGVEPISIVHNPRVRQEVYRLLKQDCQIYMRRGVLNWRNFLKMRETMKHLSRYLEKLDYAWRPTGRGGHRRLVRNKIVLSDDAL